MPRKHLFFLLLAAFLVVAALSMDLRHLLTLEHVKSQQAVVAGWRDASPLAFALGFFLTYVIVTASSFPGATVMTLLAGALFGLVWGTVLVSFASSLGATLAFLASRFLLRDWVQQRFGTRLASINEGIAREGGYYLFTLRLLPVVPFFLINLLMGLTPIGTARFYAISQLGMFPATVIYVYAGTQLVNVRSPADIVSPPTLIALALLGLFPLVAKHALEHLSARRVYARWKKPKRFDRNLIVIGGGAAGLVASYIAATVRARVTLVEAHRLGGDCLNTGCVPSKALIRSARALAEIRRAPDYGLGDVEARYRFSDVMERVQRVIRQIEPHDSAERYTALGVDVVAGQARIVSPWEVEITAHDGTKRVLSTRSIVIATGARPTVPPIPGIEHSGYLTSDTLWSLRELPQRLLVLGGGPIGCELAQCFARLGSKVTLVELAPRLLPREDPDVSSELASTFTREGITLLLGHRAREFVVNEGDRLLRTEHGETLFSVPFDALLVAVGRSANLRGFGLEELGMATERTITTNAYMQTPYPNIFAAGDVAGPYQFTHVAAHQAWYAAVNGLFAPWKRFRADYSVIPQVTFTEPEIARVGLNESEARAQGIACEVTHYGIDDLDRAIADGAAHGFVKVLTAPGSDRILGVTVVGERAGDLIAEYVLAMRHGIGLNKLLGTIHAYPTFAESAKYAAGVWKRNHAPTRLLSWLARYFAWRRH